MRTTPEVLLILRQTKKKKKKYKLIRAVIASKIAGVVSETKI